MTSPFAKLNVLVASPTAHGAGLVVTMLRSLKVPGIREVDSADAAMSELKKHPFDVVLVDDGLDGAALSKALRLDENCANRHVAIVMMSSSPDAQSIAEARDAGVTEFLRKPFAAKHLEQRLLTVQAAPREFIEAESFRGPDRRRRTPAGEAPKRRAADKAQ